MKSNEKKPKIWHNGYKPIGLPFKKRNLDYDCPCGKECLFSGKGKQKCTCGEVHSVIFNLRKSITHRDRTWDYIEEYQTEKN